MAGPLRPLALASFLFLIFAANVIAEPPGVHGALLDPQGRAIVGARVILEPAAAPARTTLTSDAGEFVFEAVPPGPAVVRVLADGFQADPVAVHVSEVFGDLHVSLAVRVSAVTEAIVVSGAAVDTPVSTLPASTTVLSADDLSRAQAASLADALRLVPGMGIAASGTTGAVTSIFPRGGESDFTLVVFDGVRLNSVGGGFDFAHLSADGLDRVEVIRGPQSALFGADAIGGVVQLVSRRPATPMAGMTLEGGSYDSRRGSASLGGSYKGWFGHGAYTYRDSQGLDGETTARGERVVNDDYLARSAVANGGWQYGEGELRAVTHWSSSSRGNPGPFGSDPNGTYMGIDPLSRGTTDQRTVGASWQHALTNAVRVRADATNANLDSGYVSAYGDSFAESTRTTARGQVDWPITPAVSVSAGAEWMREQARNTYITGPDFALLPIRRGNVGTFAEVRYESGGRLFAAGGLRAERLTRDDLPADPNGYPPRPALEADTIVSWNPKLSVSWYLRDPGQSPGTWTRVRGNAGTGIRSPDAFEIAFTDNPALAPERSRSVDAGIEQALAGGRVVADLTWFANRYDDLIVAVGGSISGASRYRTDNISNARARGLELAGRVRAPWGLVVRAGYTYLSTRILAVDGTDAAPVPYSVGDPLIRRPTHQGFVDASFSRGRADGFFRVNARGNWLDIDPTFGAFGGTLPAPGYAATDVGASWRIFDRSGTAVFARVTNLFGRQYEDVLGYPALGRSVIAGVRVAAGH